MKIPPGNLMCKNGSEAKAVKIMNFEKPHVSFLPSLIIIAAMLGIVLADTLLQGAAQTVAVGSCLSLIIVGIGFNLVARFRGVPDMPQQQEAAESSEGLVAGEEYSMDSSPNAHPTQLKTNVLVSKTGFF